MNPSLGPSNATIDHVFICCSVGAGVEAEALTRLGLREGSSNTHPGQGTACRRFVFTNAYLELFWVSDPPLAQSAAVLPTGLWERWSKRGQGACPFGIVLRPASDAVEARPPFETWPYRPQYMPPGVAIDVARESPTTVPAFFYLGFQRDPARINQEPIVHDLPITRLAAVTVWRPSGCDSAAARAVQAAGLVAIRDADEYLMELRFDDGNSGSADLRPAMPLALRW